MALCGCSAGAIAQHPGNPATPLKSTSRGVLGIHLHDLSATNSKDINLGTVSSALQTGDPETRIQGGREGFSIVRSFTLDIAKSIPGQTAFVTLSASLALPEPTFIVSVDGVVLSERPKVVASRVPTGLARNHRLQIFVPSSVTEKNSRFANTVVFSIVPE